MLRGFVRESYLEVYSRSRAPAALLLRRLLHHLGDLVLEVKLPLVLDDERAALLAVHQQGTKVDVTHWQNVVPEILETLFYMKQ